MGHSGGLLIAVREDLFEFISSSQGDFFASMVIRNKLSRLQWEVLNVYGPVHYDRKAAFLAEIIDYVLQAQGPLLMGGDFNLIRFGDEKSKGALHKTAMVQFNAAIDMMQVRELHWVGCRFTWTNKQENPTFEVLDRAFMNGSWETLFPLAITDTLVRVGSDHNPLLVDLGETKKERVYQFRMEPGWFLDLSFKEVVLKKWPVRGQEEIADF